MIHDGGVMEPGQTRARAFWLHLQISDLLILQRPNLTCSAHFYLSHLSLLIQQPLKPEGGADRGETLMDAFLNAPRSDFLHVKIKVQLNP